MDQLEAHFSGPWVVVDPLFKREWVVPEPLRYYVVESRQTGKWFICDRWTDEDVPNTEARTRDEAIRLFYEVCNRPMPDGVTIGQPLPGVAHHGENG